MSAKQTLAQIIEARDLAFFGVPPLDVSHDFSRFKEWLGAGMHADMSYMERYQDVRKDPQKIFPEARSCVVFGVKYADQNTPSNGIAKYARVQDYHKFLKREGEDIIATLRDEIAATIEGRVVVDSAPVLERALAAGTNSFFIGKNTLAIHPKQGSFFLLAELFLNYPFESDEGLSSEPNKRDADVGGCGSCKRCQVHCPTGALDSEYKLDANKCLSYWTIENRGTIPAEYWPFLEQYWYGCDICQDVCPYNRNDEPAPALPRMRKFGEHDLFEVATMNQEQYETWFGGFPLTRAKREGLMRNALIYLFVTNDKRLEAAKAAAIESGFPVLKDTIKQMEIM